MRIDGGNPAGRVDVALVEGGAAFVTWLERTGEEGAEVRIRRVRAVGATGAPATVAMTTGARASGFPRMVSAGGRLVFAWTQPGDASIVQVGHAPLR